MEDSFNNLLTEICAEAGIRLETLSHGWIQRLTKDDAVRHIVGRRFDLNTEAAAMIACDKYACYAVLSSGGVPAVEHLLLFNPLTRARWIDDSGTWAQASAYFKANDDKVVVKPSNGWQGHDVYLCETLKDLEQAMQIVFLKEPNVCLCPYYDIIHEYRVFYIDGLCPYVYGKEKAYVIGDGVTSLRRLAETLGLPDGAYAPARSEDTIPKAGEKVRVSWKHNLSNGAAAFEIEDSVLLHELHSLAKRAARCANITFATIDIAALPGGELAVMEINTGVTSQKLLEQYPNRRDVIKHLYKEAVRCMFESRSGKY